jgi:hypothetical protein
MSSRNRQLLLLGVLIVAFAWLIGRQFVPALGGGATAPAPRRSTDGVMVDLAGEPVEIAELRLEALEHKPAAYQPGRDPFRFAARPQPPQPPPPRPDPAAARRAAQQQQQQRPAPPPQPARPQPPAVAFVYLGSFGVPGREIAVFSDGKEILNAFAGDVLQREFVVRSIGYESADIGFVNFPEAPAKRLAVGG